MASLGQVIGSEIGGIGSHQVDGMGTLNPPTTSKRKATRYVSSACDFCKQRHLRCDGQEVCFQCTKRQQTCTYTQKNIKRGPKPKNKRTKKDGQSLSPVQTSMTMVGKFPVDGIKQETMYDNRKQGVPAGVVKGELPDIRSPLNQFIVPTPEITGYLLTAFVEKVSPFFPHNMRFSPQLACDLWKLMTMAPQEIRKIDIMLECFAYSVVLAYGSRVTLNEQLAMDFVSKADEIANYVFFSSIQLLPELISGFADILVSTLVMLGVFKIETYDFNGARICFVQAYNILNMNIGDVTPQVSHRLFAHMAGMSRSTKDMTHWVNSAHALGAGGSTPINRVMLSLLYCSPSMLRDPKNKPLPTELYVPASQNLLHSNDLALYQKMLREFDDTDDVVWETEQRNKQQNMETPPDYLFVYKLITEGCRSLVLAQCGFREQALGCAVKCIQYSKILQGRISFWAIPLALAYAVQVSASLNNLNLFQDGLSLFEYFPHYYGFLPPIYHTLTFRVVAFVPQMQSDQQLQENTLSPDQQQLVQTPGIYEQPLFSQTPTPGVSSQESSEQQFVTLSQTQLPQHTHPQGMENPFTPFDQALGHRLQDEQPQILSPNHHNSDTEEKHITPVNETGTLLKLDS
jgi:hypothetical protein